MIWLNHRTWGKGQRKKYAIAPEVLKRIREGNSQTDVEIAAELGRQPLSIRNIRLGMRHGA